jgi:1-acyl-sn-glycerol-3-phosphate acyltransferase
MAEAPAERIHPEVIRKLGITSGDMSGHTFTEAESTEDPKGSCQPLFAVTTLFFHRCEHGRCWKRDDRLVCGCHGGSFARLKASRSLAVLYNVRVPKLHTGTTWGTRWLRRVISIPLVFAAAVGGLVGSPALVVLALVVDTVRRRHRFPTMRCFAFVLWALWLEVCAVLSAVLLAVLFAGRLRSSSSLRWHNAMEQWWVGQLVQAAALTLRLDFAVTCPHHLRPGPVIVIGRHASHADAILPAWLLGTRNAMNLRYVIMAGLTWGPAFNLYGQRLPNHFVNRSKSHTAAHLDPIARLASSADAYDAVIIFPEGHFATPERRERALARIDDPLLAARAQKLQHLLPPRPAGTVALLDAAPHADVIVVNHVGLERFQTVGAIWRNVPFTKSVHVRVERIPAGDVPRDDNDATITWLAETWQDMDDWITANTVEVPT